jgi:hypothetical protein
VAGEVTFFTLLIFCSGNQRHSILYYLSKVIQHFRHTLFSINSKKNYESNCL